MIIGAGGAFKNVLSCLPIISAVLAL
ncbi:hypothetical protein ACPOM7_04390 [Peribacillus castrilensis]